MESNVVMSSRRCIIYSSRRNRTTAVLSIGSELSGRVRLARLQVFRLDDLPTFEGQPDFLSALRRLHAIADAASKWHGQSAWALERPGRYFA